MNYILEPISFEMKVRMNKDNAVVDGKLLIDCICEKISVCLNENQYKQIVNLGDFFHNYSKSISVCF